MRSEISQFDQFIQYGSVKHGEEFQRLHPRAKEVACLASFVALLIFKEQLVTTSIYRKKTNDSGIHEAFRAIDFAPLKSITDTYLLIKLINGFYIYDSKTTDPKRLALKVADDNPYHGTGFHIHIQVHDNTACVSPAALLALEEKAKQDKSVFQPKPLGVPT